MTDPNSSETAGDWYERCLSGIYYVSDHDCTHEKYPVRGASEPEVVLRVLKDHITQLLNKVEADEMENDAEIGMQFVTAFELLMLCCHRRNLRTLTVFYHSVKTMHERWKGIGTARRPDGSSAFPNLG
jgi:hypothetical protein